MKNKVVSRFKFNDINTKKQRSTLIEFSHKNIFRTNSSVKVFHCERCDISEYQLLLSNNEKTKMTR